MLPDLKKFLQGVRFEGLTDVKRAINRCIEDTPKKFFEDELANSSSYGEMYSVKWKFIMLKNYIII